MQIMPAKSQFAPAKIYDDLTGYRVNNRIDSVSFFFLLMHSKVGIVNCSD